tara:strand:+ start:369 stop:656 length:288 start_codon:yes stop_codon:yes gene_type:complete
MSTQKVVVEQVVGNLPEKKFRAGAISATIWLNKGHKPSGEETEYRTISIERSYTDKDGNWQSNNSLRVNDLPKARVVLQKAYEYLVLAEQDMFKA